LSDEDNFCTSSCTKHFALAGSIWDIIDSTVKDEDFVQHKLSQTLPKGGGCSADTVGKWLLTGQAQHKLSQTLPKGGGCSADTVGKWLLTGQATADLMQS